MFKQRLPFTRNKYFRFFASVKFAIIALFSFVAAMVYGTFAESIYGTEYVGKAVYYTWWFYAIEGALSMSIIFAVLDRIPLKKRLIGFYLIHLSFVLLLTGALLTRYLGIDGSIILPPGEYRSNVRLNEDVFYLSDGKDEQSFRMPSSVNPVDLDQVAFFADKSQVKLVKFLPFAKEGHTFRPAPGFWISDWLIKNDKFQQQISLANHPGTPVPMSGDLGPLRMEVLQPAYLATLEKLLAGSADSSHFVLVNTANGFSKGFSEVKAPLKFSIGTAEATLSPAHVQEGGGNIEGFEFKVQGKDGDNKMMSFFPKFSTAPITKSMEADDASEWRFVDLSAIRGKNTVFLARDPSGTIRIGFGKGSKWTFAKFEGKSIELPWMGLKVELLGQEVDQAPVMAYEEGTPSKEEGKNFKAVLARLEKDGRTEDLWVTNRERGEFQSNHVIAQLGQSEVLLPFEMMLDHFKMEQVPGTDRPASYESFVRIKGSVPGLEGALTDGNMAHIYMNNPLKAAGYTFYQSSYFQDENSGQYSSVLSINRDPGRAVKYGGSLVMVLGLILHFLVIYGYVKFDQGKNTKGTVST